MNSYWKKAIKVIPGGNLLYSKRPEMFLPRKWPTYFKKSKDCYVWDLRNKKYIDMIFAVGTNVLGYGNARVNKAVSKTIKKGNLSTLNTYDEVKLAKELLRINKWADMAKFARTGGEANTIAIRIVEDNFCKDLITRFGNPIVSTSANTSGNDTPKSFSEISTTILDSVDYIVNLQQEIITTASSRILKVTDDIVKVIRE